MLTPKTAPYGSWKSPITSDLIVSETVRLGQIALDDDSIYWLEMRPSEGGRNVVVRWHDGKTRDVTPSPFNARTTVHEYGGGAFAVKDGVVYFSNFKDQRVYRMGGQAKPQPLTPDRAYRYADAVFDARRNRLICVLEDHTVGGAEAENSLVAVPLDKAGEPVTLVAGNDFYSSPRLSPDGTRLAWLTWNHPNMPWDGTELWVAEIREDGTLRSPRKVAGGPTESIFQPEWSPDGTLYFVSDRSNWWNLYRLSEGGIEPVLPRAAEFGLPQWVFGMSTYAFITQERLLCTYFERGTWHLAELNTRTRQLDEIDTPFTHFEQIRANAHTAAFIAGAPIMPNAIVKLDLETRTFDILRRSAVINFDTTFISRPEAIEFPTENGKTAHAYFYPPQNRDFVGPEGEQPPLIVKSHGGPTGATSSTLELKTQFWTSRGFAVVDVNYGGSTGYGREYRERLKHKWGIVDVDDCVNAAKFLAETGRVDGNRTAITGGSAGGYTTLSALTFRDFFKAGASYYGICDLEALAKDTHKFESRYLDGLIGPYPEQRDVYIQRSPIHFTERLACPVIIMQGLEDKVVPPNQAQMMVDALRKKGLPVAYLAFEGEQHGFRKAETIKRSLEAELYFYSRIFSFELADPVQPVPIENLD